MKGYYRKEIYVPNIFTFKTNLFLCKKLPISGNVDVSYAGNLLGAGTVYAIPGYNVED